MIDDYPSCKRLMEAYRRVYHMPNKTPLSILFEYASRLNLQVPLQSLHFCQKMRFLPPLLHGVYELALHERRQPGSTVFQIRQALVKPPVMPPECVMARMSGFEFGGNQPGKALMWGRVCLQLSFEEGLTSNGCFTLTLQLKNERDVCLYRPGVGMVSHACILV